MPKILLLHTPNDEIINIKLVYEFVNKLYQVVQTNTYDKQINKIINCVQLIEIDGTHNNPIINYQCMKQINEYLSNNANVFV